MVRPTKMSRRVLWTSGILPKIYPLRVYKIFGSVRRFYIKRSFGKVEQLAWTTSKLIMNKIKAGS